MIRRGRPDEYRIAVPSFRRSAMLAARTLPFLAAGGVDVPRRVTVFVHDNDPQLPEYRSVAAAYDVALQVTDARGINEQRQRIIAHYPAGTPLVQCDDDVTRLIRAITARATEPVDDVSGFLRGMFLDTAARDLWVWGLSPTTNAFWMTPGRLTEGLRFLIYALVGMYVRPGHPVHRTTVPTKDDYELSLRAWWYDGAILRHDGAAADADIYKAPGGCQDTRTAADAAAAVESLRRDWPGLVRINTRRRSEFTEITLSPRGRHSGHPRTTPVPGLLAAAERGA